MFGPRRWLTGGYAGVAPEAELYFQAMENDASGNLMSPSLNSLLNTAYSNGARIHTNSWGSKSDADHGRYTSDSEDVDDRMNTYDRAYGGSEGSSSCSPLAMMGRTRIRSSHRAPPRTPSRWATITAEEVEHRTPSLATPHAVRPMMDASSRM